MAGYPINKGIGRPVEFKGLKAQYLFIFAGGLLALFVLFVILYMVGIDQWICIGFGAVSSSILVWQTFAKTSQVIIEGLFTTVTNVNFDNASIESMIQKVRAEKEPFSRKITS